MRRLPLIKYPKLLLLLATFLLAYFLFWERDLLHIQNILAPLGYVGVFIVGTLFTYGFTAAPATALLLILSKEPNSILLMGLIAGLGALLSDLIIFHSLRTIFRTELKKLAREKPILATSQKIPKKIKQYLLPVLAGFIIASPLPDEIGVFLLANSQKISMRRFILLSYLLNTAGIFIILLIGRNL